MAGSRGKGDAGAGGVAHIAEDHRHNIYGRAQIVSNIGRVSVINGAFAKPALEYGFGGQLDLLDGNPAEMPARFQPRKFS